jgi:hypothetical protein
VAAPQRHDPWRRGRHQDQWPLSRRHGSWAQIDAGGGAAEAMDLSADPLYTGSTPSLSPSHSSPFPTDRPRLPRPQPPSPTPPPAVPAPSPGCVAHAPSWLRRPRRPRLAAIPAIVIDLRVCVVERGIKLAN